MQNPAVLSTSTSVELTSLDTNHSANQKNGSSVEQLQKAVWGVNLREALSPISQTATRATAMSQPSHSTTNYFSDDYAPPQTPNPKYYAKQGPLLPQTPNPTYYTR